MEHYCLVQVNLRPIFLILKVAFGQCMSILTDFPALFLSKSLTPHLRPFEPLFDPSMFIFHKKLAIRSMA